MKQPKKPKQLRSFCDLAEDAYQVLLAAEAHWQGWWFYMGDRTRQQFVPAFRRANLYVQLVTNAHFTATVIALGKLHDDDPDAIGFATLARAARAANVQVDTKAVRQERREAARLWTKLRPIRNKVVAHLSAVSEFDDVFAEANITYNQVGRLVELTGTLLNSYLDAAGLGRWSPDNSITGRLRAFWKKLLPANRPVNPSP